MSRDNPTNVAASLRQRLLNRARAEARPFHSLAQLYAMERLLYRLGQSDLAEQFVLKGGLMTMTWAGEHARLTKDIDLLGRATGTAEDVVDALRRVVQCPVDDDGVFFDPDSVQSQPITVGAAHVGVRVRLTGDFGGMELRMQIDVGFGDAVVPAPTWVTYPQLLDRGCPRVLGYPAEATLAEKLHAATTHGHANSRMKDFYDLWTAHCLAVTTDASLGRAVHHTFSRRDTPVPEALPAGLDASFAALPDKQTQWNAFLRKQRLSAPDLPTVIEVIAPMVVAAFAHARLLSPA